MHLLRLQRQRHHQAGELRMTENEDTNADAAALLGWAVVGAFIWLIALTVAGIWT